MPATQEARAQVFLELDRQRVIASSLLICERQARHAVAITYFACGNCHDNVVAESLFSLLKKERIKRRIYPDRAAAPSDVFDYIEMFYNPVRRHGFTADLSSVRFERRYAQTGS